MSEEKKDTIVVDTSSLMNELDLVENLIDKFQLIIPLVVIQELDHLKTNIDFSKAYNARKAIKFLEENIIKLNYSFLNYNEVEMQEYGLNINLNDDIIIYYAVCYQSMLLTEDLSIKLKCQTLNIKIYEKTIETYTGYKTVVLTDKELSDFYTHLNDNVLNCYINQYVIIKDSQDNFIELRKWNGKHYAETNKKNIKTIAFGDKIKPKDEYQKMAIDSILSNQITVITGKQGSGKSLLSLLMAMYLIENDKYDKIIILCNPTKVRGTVDMGFYSGSVEEKLRQNFIGNMLNSKFGDDTATDNLIKRDKLKILSMADCRGLEIGKSILYITEAQNTTINLAKFCLGRVSAETKVIVEGDYTNQVDSKQYEGLNNGLRRLIEVYKDEDMFGFVELPNIWRSKIAEIAEKM